MKKIKIELTKKEYDSLTNCIENSNSGGDWYQWLAGGRARAIFTRAYKKWYKAGDGKYGGI